MIRTLSPVLQEKAEKELNEVPSRISSDIHTLREWLKKQPHLQSVNPPDQFLVGFLRGNKYSLERSKEKLDMYYTLKTVVPETYGDRNPFNPAIQEMLKIGIFLPLKRCSAEDATRVCICRFGQFDNSKHKMSDVLKIIYIIFEILVLEDDNYVIAGEECLLDMQDADISTFLQWTPALAKKFVISMEKSLPLRMKGTYTINAPPSIDAAHAILRMFLGEKLKKRRFSLASPGIIWNGKEHEKCKITKFLYLKDNVEEVHKIIPRRILPREYGGDDGTIQDLIDHWKVKVEKYQDWFQEQENQLSDETLRPEKPVTSSSLLGVEGSFRKLEVD